MVLNTSHLVRALQTLERALTMLKSAEESSVEFEVYRNAVVKGFELVLEMAGKLLRRSLKEYMGSPRTVDALSYKEVFRHALKYGLLQEGESVERWFAYRDNRNETAHNYGIGFVDETLALLPNFLTDAYALLKTIQEKFGHAESH